MPGDTSARIPQYRIHKPTGQGVVRLNGRDFYLGPYGTEKSKAEYQRVIGEWLANNRVLPKANGAGESITVNEVIAPYLLHAKEYYHSGERATSEYGIIKQARGYQNQKRLRHNAMAGLLRAFGGGNCRYPCTLGNRRRKLNEKQAESFIFISCISGSLIRHDRAPMGRRQRRYHPHIHRSYQPGTVRRVLPRWHTNPYRQPRRHSPSLERQHGSSVAYVQRHGMGAVGSVRIRRRNDTHGEQRHNRSHLGRPHRCPDSHVLAPGSSQVGGLLSRRFYGADWLSGHAGTIVELHSGDNRPYLQRPYR